MRRLFIAQVLVFASVGEAAPHRPAVHPNSALTIFSIAEGPDGLLWLAAADGLYRFDGFHYDKIAAYPFVSAHSVGFTRDGSLWCASVEGLARVVNHRFEIVMHELVQSMAIYPDQVFVRLGDGLGRVGMDGSVKRLKYLIRRDLTIDSSGRLWGVCMYGQTACWFDPSKGDARQPYAPTSAAGTPSALHSLDLPPGLEYLQIAPTDDGRVWAAAANRALLVENGREVLHHDRQPSREVSRAGPLFGGRNGQLWFLGERIQGLTSLVEFRDRAENDRYSPIAGFEDRSGRLWVHQSSRGLVEWNSNPQWQRWFPEDFANEPVVQTTRDAGGAVIVATQKNIYRLETSAETNGKWMPLMKDEHWFESILPLEDGGYLASTRDGVVRISRDGRIVERLKDSTPGRHLYRKILRDSKGRVWIGAKQMLLRVEGQPGSMYLRAESLPEMQANQYEDAVDLEVDAAGRLWVGYERGIAWLDPADPTDQWHKISTDQPVALVRSFTLAGDSDIWVTNRRGGSFSRLHKDGDHWRVTEFPAAGGYTPVNSYFIKRDSRGWIWRGTADGVYVSDGVHVASGDWIHLNLKNGLAANETSLYGFFEDRDGSVWIAGDEGLTRMLPDASWFRASTAAPPQVTSVDADGHQFVFPEPMPSQLPSDTKVLRIAIGSLRPSQFRDAPLRYRLLPEATEWKLSRDGNLEFRNLRSRAYTLELGYAGSGPSAIGQYRLQIGTVVNWGWTFGLLSAAGILIPVIRYAPLFERTRFRMARSLFLLRRRYSRGAHSSSEKAVGVVDRSGETLAGRYRLARLISRSGFSVVYEARDIAGGAVAVKILNRSYDDDSRMRDRFAHEVAALRSVDHPGVVRILDSWINPAGEPCLAMPFLEGPTLRIAMRDGRFGPRRTARVVRQVGDALAAVHRHGIVHRDLKPENIILQNEQAVIIDFGTAGLRTGENELAATTLMSGSFYYMAPERLTGHYSSASDVFSLGVIVLEMLTGKRLTDLNTMYSDDAFRRELEKAVGPELAGCLGPAFDSHPQRRPQEIGKWSAEIAAVLSGFAHEH
jgi:ligand-binding sensor domain-containing protein/predicted Ser/Thr protein kinase